MIERFIKKSVESVKNTAKEEAKECLDEVIPKIFEIASVALLIFASIPTQKKPKNAIIINNFYF